MIFSKSSVLLMFVLILSVSGMSRAEFRAGATIVDVTPIKFPVFVNGGMLSRSLNIVKTKLNARAIVLDDGHTRLGIVVVDSCMLPRPFLDEVKQLAAQRTKIAPERMLISATHTHSAPASMSCLGTNFDPTYVPYLREKIAEALATAEANLEPARVGWAVRDAADYTAVRRWIRRPDRIVADPFGNMTVRATMHAGSDWDNVTGESGPEDPDLSLISFQALDGRPLAVLANFSMHYFSGEQGLSADYFGLFSNGLQARLAPDKDDSHPAFVGIMSHGCSGDIWRRDYRVPAAERANPTIETYTEGLLEIAQAAIEGIEYQQDVDLAMAEQRMDLKFRVPDAQRLNWAEGIVKAMGDRPPKDRTEVYALEQIILHERQSTEVVVQAIRIGEIAIATTPNETYALTGLKLKLQSPLSATMVIELANGGDGYIPPPEQHFLGGYNTWAARSAGLEIQAEPRITEAALGLLERVAGRSRRLFRQSRGAASAALLAAKPVAYWRLDELAAPAALDSTSAGRDAIYEPGVVFFLEGPQSTEFCLDGETNRAAHFAGGRLRSRVAGLGEQYSVSLWFWNGMPVDAREVAGWMFSRGRDQGIGPVGDHLGVSGVGTDAPGKLIFRQGDGSDAPKTQFGRTEIKRWTWNHVLLVRDGKTVRVYLNHETRPEIETKAASGVVAGLDQLFFGGRCDNQANWEGRLDEIAVFDRAITPKEIEKLAGR
jgi:hypothetical protein